MKRPKREKREKNERNKEGRTKETRSKELKKIEMEGTHSSIIRDSQTMPHNTKCGMR